MSTDVKNVEILENNIVKMTIVINKDEAKKAYDETLKAMAKNAVIPGFRQGKVPFQMVEKRYGKDAIKDEVVRRVLPQHLSKVVLENKLNLIMEPYIESYEFEEDKDLKVVAKSELRPEVELQEYKNQEITFDEFKNDKNALENELKAIQERFSTTNKVEGRKTKKDDIVVFDFEGFKDNVPFDGGKAEKYTLDLAHSNFIPGFAEGLVGHEIGEEFDINVTFPENYHSEELKGAPVVFKIKLHEIKEKVLAELTDEIASKATNGKITKIDDLKADIQKYLDSREEKENTARKEDAAFKMVIDNAKIDIQKSMIDREKEAVYSENKERMASNGMNFDDIIKKEGKDKVDKEFERQAIQRIRNLLVIEKLASVEKIEVSKDEMINQINLIASQYGENKEKMVSEIIKNPSSLTLVSHQIITQKVGKILLENNTFKAKGNK